jgi:hypothetical protein
MIERLQEALKRIDEVPPEVQADLATIIEDQLAPHIDLPFYAGAITGMPDDAEEVLIRWRHEVPPTPPIEEQLKGLMDDDQGEAQ